MQPSPKFEHFKNMTALEFKQKSLRGLEYNAYNFKLTIQGDSKINSNKASQYGGGINMHTGSKLDLKGTTQVNGNEVSSSSKDVSGGGIQLTDCDMTISESVSISNYVRPTTINRNQEAIAQGKNLC